MPQRNHTVTAEYSVTYDENSPVFQEAFSGFTSMIDKNGNTEDMVKYAIGNVHANGGDRMIEGVGYIAINGVVQGEPYCGIDFDDDEPVLDVSIDF